MKAGDLVRFRHPNATYPPQTRFGLLIEYHTWEKMATILYDGGLLRVAARDVQKFGKRYLKSAEQHPANR